MYGLHFLIQETQGFLHKFRFKADLKDAVRKKAAGEREILCLMPKSEHPLLKESGRLREYDRVYAKHSPF